MTFSAAKLKGTSFAAKMLGPAPRLLVGLFGPPKSGKTHFTLSCPGTVAYQGVDYGHEGVIDAGVEGGKILPAIYRQPNLMRRPGENTEKYTDRVQKEAGDLWRKIDGDYQAALDAEVGTIVWDTADEMYNIFKFYMVGKVKRISGLDRGDIKRLFGARIKEILAQRVTSMVLIHKEEDVWQGGETTGKKKPAGFADAPYLVQVLIQTGKKRVKGKDQFFFTIVECRPNRELEGTVLEDSGFPELAQLVLPDVDPEVWYR